VSTSNALVARVAEYYEGKLTRHGATPAGVDWNSEDSQRLRFRQLLRIIEPEERSGTINDFGCGYGALAEYLCVAHPQWAYFGFDVSPKMIEAARGIHGLRSGRTFTDDRASMTRQKYTVASGIFNVKLEFDEDTWTEYMWSTLDALAALSESGFAFNVLTGHADVGRRRPDLYYADPHAVYEHCRTRFSARVALLHDYPLFEFTMLVRF
jgi:SAM-dependent methyltransferase